MYRQCSLKAKFSEKPVDKRIVRVFVLRYLNESASHPTDSFKCSDKLFKCLVACLC